MAEKETATARDQDVMNVTKGWTIKKEVSAGTLLTAALITIGAVTWGLQLEARVEALKMSYGSHASIEAHPGQMSISRNLIAEQRAIQESLKALQAINADIRQELREMRSIIYSRVVSEPRIEGR